MTRARYKSQEEFKERLNLAFSRHNTRVLSWKSGESSASHVERFFELCSDPDVYDGWIVVCFAVDAEDQLLFLHHAERFGPLGIDTAWASFQSEDQTICAGFVAQSRDPLMALIRELGIEVFGGELERFTETEIAKPWVRN